MSLFVHVLLFSLDLFFSYAVLSHSLSLLFKIELLLQALFFSVEAGSTFTRHFNNCKSNIGLTNISISKMERPRRRS